MTRISTLATTTVFLLGLSLGSQGAYAQNPQINIRMKLQDFVSGTDGAKRLASLQKAVAKMKSLDKSPPDSVDFRRSWQYWANIHGYLGPNSKFQTVAFQTDRLNNLGLSQLVVLGGNGR